METSEIRMPWQDLHEFMRKVFIQMGMSGEDAVTEADALTWATLRGVDSHGVLRIPWYLDNVESGIMNPKPDIRIISETPATVFVEADRAFGPIVTMFAVDQAMRKAREAGVGWVLIRNHTHQGAIGQYPQKIAQNGMAGLAITCARPTMVPFGARVAGLSNSPLSIGVPANRYPPLLLDMASSVVALGKVMVAASGGVPMPEGWAVDNDGNPTTDPNEFAALLPVGGPKGSGMALLFECLASITVANGLIQPVLSGELSTPQERNASSVGRLAPHNQNAIIAAIDISLFTPLEEYKAQVDALIDSLKGLPRADGFDDILMPGEREERCHDDRVANGIPLSSGVLATIDTIAKRVGVEFQRPVQ